MEKSRRDEDKKRKKNREGIEIAGDMGKKERSK